MSYTRSFKKLSKAKQLGVFLIAATLAWAAGLPSFINFASAASLTSVSDTIVSSATSTATNHTFAWTSSASVTAGQTIAIELDPTTSLFSIAGLVDTDFVGETGITVVGACGAGTDEVTVAFASNPDIITFTVCGGDTVPAGAISLPTTNNRITNPNVVGSYIIRIAGTQVNSADTRVAILQGVTMSAIVPTSLTFTITGVASSTALIGGQTTSTTTTSTGIGFGTLDVADDEIGAQLLTVSTNAQNGYSVTVVANAPLTSNTGATIDYFANNVPAAPAAWSAPTNVLGNADTYGHFGVTSDDATLPGDTFSGGTLYTGDVAPLNPLLVMYHSAPVNGATVGIGTTTVAYRIQIGSLQEAATDYANILTYVCTPVF